MSASPVAQVRMEPDVYNPYAPTTVRVCVRPAAPVSPGAIIACQLPNSFLDFRFSQSHTQRLQTKDPAAMHHVRVEVVDPPRSDVRFGIEIARRELITDTEGSVRHGQRVLATVQGGEIPAGAEVVFTFSRMTTPWVANQKEYYYVGVDGQAVEPWPTFRVVGGPATMLRLIAPSCARPGEPFRLLLVSLDRYDNVSTTAYAGVRLSVEGGATLAEDISFQGRYETTVSLPEEGVYRLAAHGLRGERWRMDGFMTEAVISNPIRITSEPMGPYWGDIHVHTHASADAIGNEPYQYGRDVSGLDFAGVCDHANADVPAQWERIVAWAREHHDPGKFVTLLGYEGGTSERYHHNVYYPNLQATFDGVHFVRGTAMPEEELREHMQRFGALSQLHQSGTCRTDMRRSYFSSTRLIEIYSHWGQSEYYNPDHALSYEVNRVRYPETRLTISGRGPYYARDAWAEGKRYVTVGSSDDHNGQAGKAHRGITGVYTSELTRAGIFGGMATGRCYATTGERILLDFRVNGQPMASELNVDVGDELSFAIEVHGTNVLCGVEVFCCPLDGAGDWESVYHQDIPDRGLQGNTQRDLQATFVETCAGPAVYYCRVRQKHLVRDRPVYAWSTPIWVAPLPK